MVFFYYSVIFVFGLVAGSFLNCVIYRLEVGQSFLKGRSYCPHCKRQLSWQDLIPVLSFLFLRGRCRYCKKPISWQYPAVETATGILFFSVFTILDNTTTVSISSFYYLAIISFLIVIFVYDLKHYIIPDKVIYPAIAIAFIWALLSPTKQWPFIYSAGGAAAFFATIVFISRGKWMGIGDIKLALLMGLFLGWPNILVAMFLSFFLGAIIGISLIAAKKKGLKSEVPFGPFLVTGTLIALFWGQDIINWYFSLIFI